MLKTAWIKKNLIKKDSKNCGIRDFSQTDNLMEELTPTINLEIPRNCYQWLDFLVSGDFEPDTKGTLLLEFQL